jgi:hypothetical protein
MLSMGDSFDLVESRRVTESHHGGCNEQRHISMKEASLHCKGMMVSRDLYNERTSFYKEHCGTLPVLL